jgi:hypothetical protein
MLKRPFTDKWNKHMNVDLKKESRKSLRSACDWKSINESKQGEFEPKGCKAHNTLIISKEVEVGARRVRALVANANSPTH